jgi:isocitrate/isopropylmalate dehydrogenase
MPLISGVVGWLGESGMTLAVPAGASLLSYCGPEGVLAGRAIQESVFEAVYDQICTADLQGHATTSEFTDEVIMRVRKKIEVWGSLDR